MSTKIEIKQTHDVEIYNFEKPVFNSKEAAAFIGCAASTLINSRYSGRLFGTASPEYIKMGHAVRYERKTLEAWLSQFPKKSVDSIQGV